MNLNPGILYTFLKHYLWLVLCLYYRRFVVIGKENVPSSGPLIFAINHQNAFMDAIVVAASSPRNPWFLARASVFSNPVARFLLSSLQMIPIYRFRDGMAAMKRNNETLETCNRLLSHNQCILIFPEGNHDGRWALRPLQKGLARIVFTTMEKSNGNTDIQIVPVGLQYENLFAGWSDLLITFGKPIAASSFFELHRTQPSHATNALMEAVRKGISELIVDIQPPEEYQSKHQAMLMRPSRGGSLQSRLRDDKQFITNFEPRQTTGEPQKPRGNKLLCPVAFLLLLPHLPALWFIRTLVHALVKDYHWTSSIRLTAFAFGAPLVYLAELYILSTHFNGWSLLILALIVLPVSGLLGLQLRDRCRGTAL